MKYSNEILRLFDDIDVSDSDYEKAIARYQSIAQYLENSNVNIYEPNIYIQGSFKLGTAIKPLTEEGSYDIDIVCTFDKLQKNEISQSELKNITGEVIKGYVTSNNMKNDPNDGKRCWTITYVDENNFHVDILPSLLNGELKEIAITDKVNPDYNKISNNWEISNPKAYCEWFKSISKYREYRQQFALANSKNIEEIPYYRVKTPLQRVVQLLKRHAEVMFENNMELKPSSIIITTLVAKAYDKMNKQEQNFIGIMKNIINQLEHEINYTNEKPCVLNPIDENENLSSKWEDENYYLEFQNWIKQLKFDFAVTHSIGNEKEEFNLIKRSMHKQNFPTEIEQSMILLPYHLKPKWEMSLWKKVEIKTTIYQKGFLPKQLTSGESISKGINIKFEAISENIKLYNIYWQVTNTGFEAQQANQLRGDFYNSELIEGKRVRKECTYYTGKHYVEAFLVKDGCCVGKSKPFVIDIVPYKKFIL